MPNKLKVLVVGKKLGKSSAYEIAGTVASECGKCQADVDVTSISENELQFILDLLGGYLGNRLPHRDETPDAVKLMKKLFVPPVEE